MSDLGIGETCETFHSSRNSPSPIEMLNSAGVILNAVFLSILTEMYNGFGGVRCRQQAIYLLFCAENVSRTVEVCGRSVLVQVEKVCNSSPRKVCFLKVRGSNNVTTS